MPEETKKFQELVRRKNNFQPIKSVISINNKLTDVNV